MVLNKYSNKLIVVFVIIFLRKVAESVCPDGYYANSAVGDCYKIYNDLNVNYEDAEATCSNDGAHLAYIPNCNKFSNLNKFLQAYYNPNEDGTGLWIGAKDDEEEGQWLWGNGYPVLMGVPFWGTSEPDWDPEPNGGPNANCAQLSNSDQFYFHDEDCEGLGTPLCHYEDYDLLEMKTSGGTYKYEAVSCPENFTYIGESCYFFATEIEKKTYQDAESFCREMDAHLPIVKDCLEFQELVQEIGKNYALVTDESYWIGVSDEGHEGKWAWSDYSIMQIGPPFWGSTNGKPEPGGGIAQNCGILYKNDRYYIHDGECDVGTKILCQTSAISNENQ